MDDVQGAVTAVRDQTHMADPGVAPEGIVDRCSGFHDAADDVDQIAVPELRRGQRDLGERQISVVMFLDRNRGLQAIAAEQELGAVDALEKFHWFPAGDRLSDVAHQPAIGGIPVGLSEMVAGGHADVAVPIADPLQEEHEAGPVAAEGHREGVLGEDQAIALGETVDRLGVIGLERHLAEEIELVGLAEIFPREMDDAFPQVRFNRLEMVQVRTDLRFGELVKRLVGRGRGLGRAGGLHGEGGRTADGERQESGGEVVENSRHGKESRKRGDPYWTAPGE